MRAVGSICIGITSAVFGLPFWAACGVIFISYLAFGKK
jgi:hypothetical protein